MRVCQGVYDDDSTRSVGCSSIRIIASTASERYLRTDEIFRTRTRLRHLVHPSIWPSEGKSSGRDAVRDPRHSPSPGLFVHVGAPTLRQWIYPTSDRPQPAPRRQLPRCAPGDRQGRSTEFRGPRTRLASPHAPALAATCTTRLHDNSYHDLVPGIRTAASSFCLDNHTH